MIKEFKEFLLRGNLLDLAVAVVIGAAFTAVVNAFVSDLITPLIKAIFGGTTQFESLARDRQRFEDLPTASVLDALLNFVIVAAGDLLPGDQAGQRADGAARAATPSEEPVRECPECLSKVPDAGDAGAPTAPRR